MELRGVWRCPGVEDADARRAWRAVDSAIHAERRGEGLQAKEVGGWPARKPLSKPEHAIKMGENSSGTRSGRVRSPPLNSAAGSWRARLVRL